MKIDSDFSWLHLSDFHTGKDDYEQSQVFKRVLSEIRGQISSGRTMDMVFITGDIANLGETCEYNEFNDNFITPLVELLGLDYLNRIFIIPGNHDVSRKKARAVMKQGVLETLPEFLDPTNDGHNLRLPLLSRFENFENHDWLLEIDRWISSDDGFSASVIPIRGKNIGVLQLNTSWLCEGSSDFMMLSPGINMVEKGLQELNKCDKIVVLGHHPLGWFIPTDSERITALFAQSNVLYLHGHLHKTRQGTQLLANHSFTSVQAGCAFDTRNSEVWVTRIVWGAFDLKKGHLYLKPRKWKSGLNEWGDDSDHIPESFKISGADEWCVPTVYAPVNSPKEKLDKPSWIPKGWDLLTKSFFEERSKELSDETILQYLEGRSPNWSDILSKKIPEREIVKELTQKLLSGIDLSEKQLVLLIGAGGEGKSTAFLQTIVNIHNVTDVKILWRYDPEQPLPIEFIKKINNSEEKWIIVSDEGDSLVNDTKNALQYLRNKGNLQIFLACRDTDWIEKRGNDTSWAQICNFVSRQMKGLNYTDAQSIVKSWTQYGERGLGKLANVSEVEAIELLLKAAQEESSDSCGSFLGAMLRVRVGDALKDHVAELMSRLDIVKIPSSSAGRTLLDALMYISVPHSFNMQFLSKSILAECFDIEEFKLRKEILKPLGEEAAAEAAGDFILTRHRAIAEATLQVGEQRFGFDAEEILCDLVSASIRANDRGASVPHLTEWRFLSTKFNEAGNASFAVRLAKAALKDDPKNSFLLVKLAQLYRETGQPEQTLNVFRSAHLAVVPNRGYFTEWAANESSVGNSAISAWLNAVSISDNIGAGFPKLRDIGFGLVGCCLSFIRLYEDFGRPVFAFGAIAADLISRSLNLDYKSYELLATQEELLTAYKERFKPAARDLMKCIYNAIKACYEQREVYENLSLPIPDDLNFQALESLVDVSRVRMPT
jgi:hypothetical protein